ncbi:DUF4278 domain-containing protein [Leptolyngbya sp. FACHB-671]|nr:DUF4278 domain-containing protein [Leptolyngbya sp. FACHB-671]
MKLCYRGADYEVTQSIQLQQTRVTSVTLTYRGKPYQSNQYQLMTHGIGSQRSITNQSPQISSRKPTTPNSRLIYRGVAHTL